MADQIILFRTMVVIDQESSDEKLPSNQPLHSPLADMPYECCASQNPKLGRDKLLDLFKQTKSTDMKTHTLFKALALCLSFGANLSATQTQAQEVGKHALDYTYAEGSPEYWRNTHSTRPGNFVFRRDPNIWVYTPEVAKRVGMPLEWASDELKGVAAAAFRMERDGAEENCGWGGNPKACKPVVRCVLELYFDRQTHPLPWAPNRLVADFDWQGVSTAYHFLPSLGAVPEANGDRSRSTRGSSNYPSLGSREPFADPQTGDELIFANSHSNAGWGVLAYDREIHGRYAFVRLDDGCGRPERDFSKGQVLQLRPGKRFGEVGKKVFHEVTLPASWTKRIRELTDKNWQQDNDFYKNTWNNPNQGDKK